MSEELAEIEKAISQASNIIETLMRLQQKIDQQQQPLFQTNSEQLVAQHTGLSRLRDKFTDLNARIDSIVQSLDPALNRSLSFRTNRDQDVRFDNPSKTTAATEKELAEQTYKNLRAAVADETMTPDQAATELLRLAPSELPASQKIVLREAARTAFENAGDPSLITKQFNNAMERPKQAKGISINTPNV